MIEIVTTLIYILVTGIVGILTAAFVYARWHYGTLEKVKGLRKVIPPSFVGGSDIHLYKKNVHEQDIENVKTHGKIFGFYEGSAPHLYIADVDLLRLILIKDFDHFHGKRFVDFGNELINQVLGTLPYEKWKLVRNFVSPVFTSGKMRSMSVTMSETIDEWMKTVLAKHDNNQLFNPKEMYTALTSDVIARCGFGIKLNSLHDPNDKFVQNLKKFALDDLNVNFMLTVAQTFPFLTRLVPLFPVETLDFFNDIIKNIMKTRRERGIRVNDFADTLNDMLAKLDTEEYKKLGITETTVMSQALIFFLAGYETTASTLTFLTYNLAKYPDVQEKLVKEVDSYLSRHDGKIGHETIGELTYMSACINETLRMFSPLIRVERICNKDWYHEPTGLSIPKGMVIQIPVHAIHYDEEYFPEPYAFKPERFLPENKANLNQYAFLSFGAGGHNCIGIRFVKDEIQLALTNVLKYFTFKPTAEMKIKYKPGRTFLLSAEPIQVEAVKR